MGREGVFKEHSAEREQGGGGGAGEPGLWELGCVCLGRACTQRGLPRAQPAPEGCAFLSPGGNWAVPGDFQVSWIMWGGVQREAVT